MKEYCAEEILTFYDVSATTRAGTKHNINTTHHNGLALCSNICFVSETKPLCWIFSQVYSFCLHNLSDTVFLRALLLLKFMDCPSVPFRGFSGIRSMAEQYKHCARLWETMLYCVLLKYWRLSIWYYDFGMLSRISWSGIG